MSRLLQPIFTFDQVYGPDRVYAPRAHPQTSRWITRDPAMLDWLTGNQLCVAGSMPVVCTAGATTPRAWELLAEAGIARAKMPMPFKGETRAFDVARAAAVKSKLVLQHAYPEGVVEAASQWVAPELLAKLNNKANLPDLAPAGHVPPRTVYARARAFDVTPQLPVVIKAATDHSTGGGVAVAVCRTAKDVADAADLFEGCNHVVVEDYLPIARNVCLHFAVMPDGQTLYVGFADQDITEGGKYRGNWIDLGSSLPQPTVEVGLAVARRGAEMGYRGFVGIDIAILEGDEEGKRALVLDLNFRVNGSTAAALLAPAIRTARGNSVLHLRTFLGNDGFAPLISAAKTATKAGKIIPLSAFDPEPAGYSGIPSRLVALVRAESRSDALRVEADLAGVGLA